MSRAEATVNGVAAFLAGEMSEPPCWCGQHPLAAERNHEPDCAEARAALWRLLPRMPEILQRRRQAER
jgi:hypothetical protein